MAVLIIAGMMMAVCIAALYYVSRIHEKSVTTFAAIVHELQVTPLQLAAQAPAVFVGEDARRDDEAEARIDQDLVDEEADELMLRDLMGESSMGETLRRRMENAYP